MRLRGNYERIFPLTEEQIKSDAKCQKMQAQYDFLIAASKEIWGEQTTMGGINAKKKIEELDKKAKGATSQNTVQKNSNLSTEKHNSTLNKVNLTNSIYKSP